jgi:hypothetical protein
MRAVRVLLGILAVLVSLPLLLGGIALWAVMQHRAPDGSFTAPLTPTHVDGYAMVVPDIDALLRREAPFARTGQTTLRVTASTPGGPAFIGLAPADQVRAYLHGSAYANVTRVRLARGGLPVNTRTVPGGHPLAAGPLKQAFWLSSSTSGSLFWSPTAIRDKHLSLVVMSPDGTAPVEVTAAAAMSPQWLDPTTWGALVLGTVAFLVGMVLLFWPHQRREYVYLVEPGRLPPGASWPVADPLERYEAPLMVAPLGEENHSVVRPPAAPDFVMPPFLGGPALLPIAPPDPSTLDPALVEALTSPTTIGHRIADATDPSMPATAPSVPTVGTPGMSLGHAAPEPPAGVPAPGAGPARMVGQTAGWPRPVGQPAIVARDAGSEAVPPVPPAWSAPGADLWRMEHSHEAGAPVEPSPSRTPRHDRATYDRNTPPRGSAYGEPGSPGDEVFPSAPRDRAATPAQMPHQTSPEAMTPPAGPTAATPAGSQSTPADTQEQVHQVAPTHITPASAAPTQKHPEMADPGVAADAGSPDAGDARAKPASGEPKSQ